MKEGIFSFYKKKKACDHTALNENRKPGRSLHPGDSQTETSHLTKKNKR